MLRKNKVTLAFIILVITGISGFAQNNNTSSPFSRYGLGDLNHYGFGRTAAMGGASLGSRHSVQINSANPASYNSNDSLSFIFDFGLDGTYSHYKSATQKMNVNDVNFRYFALSWPVTKWLGGGMGVQPFSDMGYDVSVTETLTGVGNVYSSYQGEGSTSKAYFGMAISPFKGFSLGANLNYIFGRLNQNTTIGFDSADLFFISKTEGTRLRDFTLTYGMQYDMKLKENEYLTIGATYEGATEMVALHRIFSEKIITINSSSLVDTLENIPEYKGKIKFPTTFGIGLSYNKINKLEINADYYYAGWSKATFFGEKLYNPTTDNVELVDKSRLSFGAEYVPNYTSIRSYFSRVKYRAGIHHESSYLKLNGRQIKEFGVSFGAGFPFPKSKSTANFALELGKKGRLSDDLVRSNYTKFSLYLNLYDYWFIKRKFD